MLLTQQMKVSVTRRLTLRHISGSQGRDRILARGNDHPIVFLSHKRYCRQLHNSLFLDRYPFLGSWALTFIAASFFATTAARDLAYPTVLDPVASLAEISSV